MKYFLALSGDYQARGRRYKHASLNYLDSQNFQYIHQKNDSSMGILTLLIVIGLHACASSDAMKIKRKAVNGHRTFLAYFPPVIGPVIYLLTMTSANDHQLDRPKFMEGKKRFS